jgi:hypothetical protein
VDGRTYRYKSRPRSSVGGAFGFKPPDLGPQLFDLLAAEVDGLTGAAMTEHLDPYHQANPTRTVERGRQPQAVTA